MQPIYLDYNATTPVAPEVLDAMLPFLRGEFGNPSSAHALGKRAQQAMEQARAEVAALIGAEADEIIFTSGGTEASNIAIRGAVTLDPKRSAIVTSAFEHPATEACCALLERAGHRMTRVKPGPDGRVRAEDFAAAIGRDTALVTVIHAQNETGTLQPIAAIAKHARDAGALLHADAAQSLGKVPVDVRAMGIDLMSIAGHKLYAPKGVGALFARRGVTLPPLVVGAGQEHGRRPGTENVPYIVGLGAACRLALRNLATAPRLRDLSNRLHARLAEAVPGLRRVGHAEDRLPNTLNLLFPGIAGRVLLETCPQVQASTGSACHAGVDTPSAVLLAIGTDPAAAIGAVRLSLGHATSPEDVDAAAAALIQAWRSTSLRRAS